MMFKNLNILKQLTRKIQSNSFFYIAYSAHYTETLSVFMFIMKYILRNKNVNKNFKVIEVNKILLQN